MDISCLQKYLLLSAVLMLVQADPEFCTRGFKMASRFYKCWEQATFSNKYPPLNEPHEYLDNAFVEAYATHMCSVVKPDALKCLERSLQECGNIKKLMAMADKSGGACKGNRLNPFFKTHVIDKLVPIKGDSPCFKLSDNTYECYKRAGETVMSTEGQADDIVTFHRVADRFFGAYWNCMVEIYKSNEEMCPNWQIPMLLTLQKTAMPSLFGLRLRPEQVKNLELGSGDNSTEGLNPGPSRLYLLIQLHKTKPEVVPQEDSVVLELSDLNEEHPRLETEGGMSSGNAREIKSRPFTLKEIKKLMRETRRRNKELKEFIKQAKMGQGGGGGNEEEERRRVKEGWNKKKKSGGKSVSKVRTKSKKVKFQKKLSLDTMIA